MGIFSTKEKYSKKGEKEQEKILFLGEHGYREEYLPPHKPLESALGDIFMSPFNGTAPIPVNK